ncbi:MAG TPA: hypothetical protein VIN67_01075, partial [Desulfobaccales bacterium]
ANTNPRRADRVGRVVVFIITGLLFYRLETITLLRKILAFGWLTAASTREHRIIMWGHKHKAHEVIRKILPYSEMACVRISNQPLLLMTFWKTFPF